MIGKLKKSISEKCPVCGKTLQIRVIKIKTLQKGVEAFVEEEYICCSNKNCDYERETVKKKKSRKNLDTPPSFE